jgi:hypothetical protein
VRIELFGMAVAADFAPNLLHFEHSKPIPMGSIMTKNDVYLDI